METKLINFSEVKFAADDATRTFTGYGAVFSTIDQSGDVIAPGAFKSWIESKSAPLMFLNHDARSLPIGKWTEVAEDEFGLKVTGEFLDTAAGRDAYVAAKSGAITGLSIGYIARDVSYRKSPSDPRRLLKAIDVGEISVVTFPMNSLARIRDVKSAIAECDFESALCERGMTPDEAKCFVEAIRTSELDKYNQAAFNDVARNLLSKLTGEK